MNPFTLRFIDIDCEFQVKDKKEHTHIEGGTPVPNPSIFRSNLVFRKDPGNEVAYEATIKSASAHQPQGVWLPS